MASTAPGDVGTDATRLSSRVRSRDLFKQYKKPYANEFRVGKGTSAFVYEDLCIGCTQCLDSCNVDAIIMVSKVITLRDRQYASYKSVILPDACVGCRKCAVDCPVHAIDMMEKEAGWESRAEAYKTDRKRKEDREKEELAERAKRAQEWLAGTGAAPAAEAITGEGGTAVEAVAAVAEAVVEAAAPVAEVLTELDKNWPHYDVNTCISCSACAEACPTSTITMKLFGDKEYPTWVLTTCTTQGACATACPTGSITMEAGRQAPNGKFVLG